MPKTRVMASTGKANSVPSTTPLMAAFKIAIASISAPCSGDRARHRLLQHEFSLGNLEHAEIGHGFAVRPEIQAGRCALVVDIGAAFQCIAALFKGRDLLAARRHALDEIGRASCRESAALREYWGDFDRMSLPAEARRANDSQDDSDQHRR